MYRALTLSIILSFAFCLLPGCGESLPPGMPRLYPAIITVTQEGTPLEGATVQLIPEDQANAQWGPGGTTNASGVAVLYTNARFRGAPLGEYRVTVTKRETEPHPHPELSGGDRAQLAEFMRIAQSLKTYNYVEPQYSSITETPLRIEITARERNYEVDAGQQVRIEARLMR